MLFTNVSDGLMVCRLNSTALVRRTNNGGATGRTSRSRDRDRPFLVRSQLIEGVEVSLNRLLGKGARSARFSSMLTQELQNLGASQRLRTSRFRHQFVNGNPESPA